MALSLVQIFYEVATAAYFYGKGETYGYEG